jgi:hypothetical protein
MKPGSMSVSSNVKMAEISAVKIRADGTRENLGVISRYRRNPLVRFWHWLKRSAL